MVVFKPLVMIYVILNTLLIFKKLRCTRFSPVVIFIVITEISKNLVTFAI